MKRARVISNPSVISNSARVINRLSPLEFTKRVILSKEPKRSYRSYKEPLKVKLIDAFHKAYQHKAHQN